MTQASSSGHTLLLNREVVFDVATMGPGRRAHLVTQGCSIRCTPTCMNVDTWRRDRRSPSIRSVPVEELADQISGQNPDGLSIAGGEPTDQVDAILALCHLVKLQRPNCDILLSSGHDAAWLRASFPQLWTGSIDAIVAGPFDPELTYLPGSALPTVPRGSSNQTCEIATELGRKRYELAAPDASSHLGWSITGVTLRPGGRIDIAASGTGSGSAGMARFILKGLQSEPSRKVD